MCGAYTRGLAASWRPSLFASQHFPPSSLLRVLTSTHTHRLCTLTSEICITLVPQAGAMLSCCDPRTAVVILPLQHGTSSYCAVPTAKTVYHTTYLLAGFFATRGQGVGGREIAANPEAGSAKKDEAGKKSSKKKQTREKTPEKVRPLCRFITVF